MFYPWPERSGPTFGSWGERPSETFVPCPIFFSRFMPWCLKDSPWLATKIYGHGVRKMGASRDLVMVSDGGERNFIGGEREARI